MTTTKTNANPARRRTSSRWTSTRMTVSPPRDLVRTPRGRFSKNGPSVAPFSDKGRQESSGPSDSLGSKHEAESSKLVFGSSGRHQSLVDRSLFDWSGSSASRSSSSQHDLYQLPWRPCPWNCPVDSVPSQAFMMYFPRPTDTNRFVFDHYEGGSS